MDVKFQEARERLYDAVTALESIEGAVNGALRALDNAFVALNQMEVESAVELESKAAEEEPEGPFCAICGAAESVHLPDLEFVYPKVESYNTEADTRILPESEPEMGDWDELYELMGLGERK